MLSSAIDAANRRAHSELTPLLKQLVAINALQCDNAKGVSELTDDPALKAGLIEATARASEALQRLLEVIKQNPYDAEAIIAEIENVKKENSAVREIVEKIIHSETADDGAEVDISDRVCTLLIDTIISLFLD